MPKNLLDVLKGTLGGGAGIKGDWDCTPIIGADFSVVDSYRATYNAETKIASADWSSIPTAAPGQPYIGMLKTDLTLGTISLNEVKKLSLQITADLADPTAMIYLGAFFLDSNAYTAEDAANMLFGMMMLSTPLPKPNIYTVGRSNLTNSNRGIAVSSAISAVTDDFPSGMGAASNTLGNNYVDTASAGAGDNLTLFLSRTPGALPENGESINVASAIFDSTGTMLTVGQLAELTGNPVINSEMTMYIGFLTMIQSGSVLPPASVGVDVTAGPNTATLSDIIFTSGSLSFTQGDWDLVYPSPATPFIPINQAVFPQGAKKNDQFRVKIQPPATQGTPYGTVVTPEAVVVVDNVNVGQEAFRVMVDSANMEARLAQLDFSTQIGALTALVDEAGRRAGEMVFYVRSVDPGLEPLVGPGVYDSFELAYEAAILQPKHIRKYIVIDDRSTSYRPTISFKTTGDRTWYLAANNIEMSTVRAFDRIVDPSQVPTGEYPYYFNEIVDVRGRFDGLHFVGGAWAIAHGRDYNNYDPFCVPSSPSSDVETPSGMRRALEMGDNTKVMLSPLSYNLNAWDEAVLHVGNNCTLMIFTDVSYTAMNNSSAVMAAFPHIYNYDGYHATAGRVTGKSGMTTIYAGTNFSLQIGYGSPENGVASFPLTVRTPARYQTIHFNSLTGCSHVVEGVGLNEVLPLIDSAVNLAIRNDGSLQLVRITNRAEYNNAATTTYVDVGGTTVYVFNDATKLYLLASDITLTGSEAMQLGNGVRFIGTGRLSSSITGQNYAGWLIVQAGLNGTFENIRLTVQGQGIFLDNIVNGDITFKGCGFRLTGVQGHTFFPTGSGNVVYDECYTDMVLLVNNSIQIPATFNAKVRLHRCIFDDLTGDQGSNAASVFSFADSTINGQIIFKDCEVRTTISTPGSYKRTLVNIRGTGTGSTVIVTNQAGIVFDNNRKNWNDDTYNSNEYIIGQYRNVPNLVYIDDYTATYLERGKRVIPVYDANDWPSPEGANTWVDLKSNAIYRIHGEVKVPSNVYFLGPGTEIEGASGGTGNDQLIIGLDYFTSSNFSHLVTCGDNWAIRNLAVKVNTTTQVYGVWSIPSTTVVDAHTTYTRIPWNSGIPAVLENVDFYNWDGTNLLPIRFDNVFGVAVPDFEFINVTVPSHSTAKICIVGGDSAIRNLVIRNYKAITDSQRANPRIAFGNFKWSGTIKIHDCELSEAPVTINSSAGLTVANRVTAFNNRGVTTAGVYNNAVSTYVDGILMSDTTLMLAQGNIFGAPNSP